MKKFNAWVDKIGDILPVIWGVLWIVIITLVSTGATIWSVKWVLKLLGVM